MPADVGQSAPDFTLPSTEGGEVSLSSFKGKKNVVVFFFPKAFTGTCEKQVHGHAADLDKFKALDAEVFGISTDQTPSQQAFSKQCEAAGKLNLLSDNRFKTVMAYGVGKAEGGLPNDRASFVIDKKGVIRHKQVEAKPGDWSGTAGALEALRQIQG